VGARLFFWGVLVGVPPTTRCTHGREAQPGRRSFAAVAAPSSLTFYTQPTGRPPGRAQNPKKGRKPEPNQQLAPQQHPSVPGKKQNPQRSPGPCSWKQGGHPPFVLFYFGGAEGYMSQREGRRGGWVGRWKESCGVACGFGRNKKNKRRTPGVHYLLPVVTFFWCYRTWRV